MNSKTQGIIDTNIRFQYIINELIDQYAYADRTQRPWIIGFSGGKDSTVLLTLVWEALLKLKKLPTPFQLRRPVYVVCNDTLVENPLIAHYTHKILNKIEEEAKNQSLPVYVIRTVPRLEDSFWVNTIGRGYPVPNSAFRWCTDKLKIKPTSRFIEEQVAADGEAIILLGTRINESANRARSFKKSEIKGKRLTKHPNQANTFIYAPIKFLMLEEIWYLINSHPSPWKADNSELFQIYTEASADDYECPTMVTNKNHTSCGQSRFGCWSCTVVPVDKSMTTLIKNGHTWMKPLLDLHKSMIEERNKPENRQKRRRDGSLAVNGMGTYKDSYKKKLLTQLLQTQKQIQNHAPEINLISNQELIAIQTNWYRDLIFDYKVSDIYNQIYNKNQTMNGFDLKQQKEFDLLKSVCDGSETDFKLIQELLILQKNKALLNRKRGLKDDMERVIEKYLYAN
jgi:DNA sulfur modification protein DndC